MSKLKKEKITTHIASKADVELKQQPVYLYALVAIMITAIVFWGCLSCGFVNYDDELYIKNNALLQSLSGQALWDLFFTSKGIYGGNYHPLLTFTNALEYQQVGYEPFLYHLNNLILHLMNTVLVFYLIFTLSRKNIFISFLVALLFGIHPMHVESVVWISERKDVLYSLFYLLSIILYLKFENQKKAIFYVLSLLCFLLSLMSKSMAVTLPLVLWAISYYLHQKVDRSFYIKTLPFWLLALGFGLLAIYSQNLQGYIGDYKYSIIDKFFLASYSWAYYIIKLFVPVQLSVLHPFPQDGLGILYYLSPLCWILLIFIIRKFKKLRPLLLFGFLFYTFSIFIVLQFISVGAAVVSERYTYLPYIGLFFIIATLLEPYYVKHKQAITGLLVVVCSIYAFLSFQRIKVWEDGETLWRDATQKHPETADYAWFGLANILKDKKGNPQEIVAAYNKAISINSTFPNYYLNSSSAKSEFGDKQGALKELNRAIGLNPNYIDAFYNRGILYEDLQEHQKAIDDYTKAIQLKPTHLEAIFNRGIAYKALKNYDMAMKDYQKVIELNPSFINVYTNLGNIYMQLNQFDQAISYYNKGIALDSKQGVLFLNRAIAWLSLNKKTEACNDFNTAAQLGDPKAQQAVKDICQ